MPKNSIAWIRTLVIGLILALMAFFIPSGGMLAAEAAAMDPLPLEAEAGPAPDGALYTETSYTDPSLSVEIFHGRTEDTEYIYARIVIADPTQLRTAAAGTFSYASTYIAASIAKRVNAVLAVNGDFYSYQQRVGYVVRQGRRYRNCPTGQDLLLIDSNGDFHGVHAPETAEDVAAYLAGLPKDVQIWNAFSFGPILVENGEAVFTENIPYFIIATEKKTQRVGIGQLGPLEYYIVSTEGPEDDEDSGLTVADFAALMAQVGYELSEDGAVLAYNLDGGSSNSVIFNNVKINSADRAKARPIGDIIYFSTLINGGAAAE